MPTVYILQESDQDFSDAKRFGNIVVILVGKVPDQVKACSVVYGRLLQHLQPGDFIVPTGSPMVILAAGAAMRQLQENEAVMSCGKNHLIFNILLWNRKTLNYDVAKWIP